MTKNAKKVIGMAIDAAKAAEFQGRYADAAAHYDYASRLYSVEYRMSGKWTHVEEGCAMRVKRDECAARV